MMAHNNLNNPLMNKNWMISKIKKMYAREESVHFKFVYDKRYGSIGGFVCKSGWLLFVFMGNTNPAPDPAS